MAGFSIAAERNRAPILEALDELLPQNARVLEVGSGTGQHADAFSQSGALFWQTSNPSGPLLDDLNVTIATLDRPNLPAPVALDLLTGSWPQAAAYSALYAANVLHIAPWPATEALFLGARKVLDERGLVILYGPFRYLNRTFEPSNEAFDKQLRSGNVDSGIRVFEEVAALAKAAGFELIEDRDMPANNRLLVFQK